MQLNDEVVRSYVNSEDRVVAALASEVIRLREGIRLHQSKKGHELCWLNDVALWQLLDPAASYPHHTLPVRDEFLAQCAKYYESRVTATPYEDPQPRKTVANTDRG